MPKYRYRPADNRTPVNHPVIGHLEYDGIYDNPACAGDPDFVVVGAQKSKSSTAKRTSSAKNPTAKAAGTQVATDDKSSKGASSADASPPAKAADAGEAGRS